jgi:transcription antitermination factor NusG
MIYVLESYLNSRRAKIEEWKEAGQKWMSEKNGVDGYYGSCYNMRDYENKHPYPVVRWENILPFLIVPLLLGLISFALWFFIWGDTPPKAQTKTTAKAQQSQTQKKTGFKMGDTVQVVYGDYKDSVGVIVKLRANSAIIKLTNSTYTKADAGSGSTAGTDDGELLSVGSLENLVMYKEVK